MRAGDFIFAEVIRATVRDIALAEKHARRLLFPA